MPHKASRSTVAHYLDIHKRTVARLIDTVFSIYDVVHRSRVSATGVGPGSGSSTLSARHTAAIQSLLSTITSEYETKAR
jgi:hypothetical protein